MVCLTFINPNRNLKIMIIQSAGLAPPSFVSSLLEEQRTSEERRIIKNTALGLYAGGSDTVSITPD